MQPSSSRNEILRRQLLKETKPQNYKLGEWRKYRDQLGVAKIRNGVSGGTLAKQSQQLNSQTPLNGGGYFAAKRRTQQDSSSAMLSQESSAHFMQDKRQSFDPVAQKQKVFEKFLDLATLKEPHLPQTYSPSQHLDSSVITRRIA